jgi:hypothetical protein
MVFLINCHALNVFIDSKMPRGVEWYMISIIKNNFGKKLKK